MNVFYLLKNLYKRAKSDTQTALAEAKGYTDAVGTVTRVTGTITTKAWDSGQGGPTWTAPKDGTYLVLATYAQTEDNITWSRKYHQFRLAVTNNSNSALWLSGDNPFYNIAGSSFGVNAITTPFLIYMRAGDQLTPYLWTDTASMTYNVIICGVWLNGGVIANLLLALSGRRCAA